MKRQKVSPTGYTPSFPFEFIGGASKRASTLIEKVRRLLESKDGRLKLLLYGIPGVGKTRLAAMVAQSLTKSPLEIQTINGRDCTIEMVRAWREATHYRSLLGGWTVKVVNELDLCTPPAQDLLLSYLDELPEGHAFIGTSNLNLGSLADRFQTRLQQMRVDAPSTAELAEFLKKGWSIPEQAAQAIAVGSGGNVRAALMDLETYMDERITK